MTLNKKQALFAVLAFVAGLCLFYQSLWMFSRTTMADVIRVRTLTGRRFSGLKSIDASYTVNYDTYYGNFLDAGFVNKLDHTHPRIQIRYLDFAPGIARSDIFLSNWGPSFLIFGISLFIATVVFLRKDILADSATFTLQRRMPFIKLQHNEIPDYDQHMIDTDQAPVEQEAIRQIKQVIEKLPSATEIPDYQISAGVNKFNPNAIGVFVIYLLFVLWCLYSFFSIIGSPVISLVVLGILLFVPLYVQNTKNKTFKAKIPDNTVLAFATDGILFKDLLYPAHEIEAAAVSLESFMGFKYRDRTSLGNAVTISDGDNNKISFRYNGEIQDLTFYLEDYKDYFSLKNLLALWSSRGTNIFLQRVFEDEFIIQEMAHFSVPTV